MPANMAVGESDQQMNDARDCGGYWAFPKSFTNCNGETVCGKLPTPPNTRFKDKDQSLVFECFNEPHVINPAQLNQLWATCVSTIRRTNPMRVIQIGGLLWCARRRSVESPFFLCFGGV